MQDYDGVIIWDLHSTERNRYLKYCFAHSVRCYVSPKISDIILMGSERIHLLTHRFWYPEIWDWQ